MASRRSHAASQIINQRRVIRNFVLPCPEGTRICQKPTASSEGAPLWDKHHLTLSWFREAGPAAHTQSACVRGCVAMPCKYRTKSKKLLQNKN